MNLFWSEKVPSIGLFGYHHWIYIGVLLLCLLLLVYYRNKVRTHAEVIRKSLLLVAIAQQLLLYFWYIFETGFDISESLPFHISRISSLLGISYLLTKNSRVMNILFYFGLYAYGSFLIPSRVYPISHAIGISFLVNHVITLLLPLFASMAYDWRPTLKSLFTSYGYFLIYFFFVYFLNPLIDGNYFYLKYRPVFKELPDYLYNPGALVFTFVLFYIAFFVYRTAEKSITGNNLCLNK